MKKIEEILKESAVEEVVSDFFKGKGVQDIFPEVNFHSCAFHWTESVCGKFRIRK